MVKAKSLHLAILIASSALTGCRDTAGGDTSESKKDMVMIPGGTHEQLLANNDRETIMVQPFLLDPRAVTNQEFLEFVKANPRWKKSKALKLYVDDGYLKHWTNDLSFPGELRNSPVTNISWYAARAYSEWKGKRLPTMAEWEYVGSGRLLNHKIPLEKVILSWYSKPTPKVLPAVHSTYQNEYKVYDMHGLIWEWVSDFNSVISEGTLRRNSASTEELFCGSGDNSQIDENNYATFMRYAFRGSLKANYTVNNLGFRCAADIK